MANHMDNQLLQYLPEVIRQEVPRQIPDRPGVFRLDRATHDFLLAFEKILLGRVDTFPNAPTVQGLEQTLNDLARYFTPGTSPANGAPDEFLPWLSQWVALSLRTDIFDSNSEDSNGIKYEAKNNAIRRTFIAQMPELYRTRGTQESLTKLLEVFTQGGASGVTIESPVEGKPHFFKVMLNLETYKHSDSDTTPYKDSKAKKVFERTKELAHSVIRLEKPAHTHYLLIPAVTTMRIGLRKKPPRVPSNVEVPTKYNVIVGVNTRLGFTPKNFR